MTNAIVEKLVLEKEKARHEALEALVRLVAETIKGQPGRGQQPVQASADMGEIYNQAAA